MPSLARFQSAPLRRLFARMREIHDANLRFNRHRCGTSSHFCPPRVLIEGYQEMRLKGAEEARRIVLGEAVRNPVNLHMLKGPTRAVVTRS